MHPKIRERRGAVLSEQFAQIDRDIEVACISLAQLVRLAGSLCIGDAEAESLERQFQTSVDYIIKIPAHFEEGRFARRELIHKLLELETYLESLLRPVSAKAELKSGSRQDLDQCRQSLDRLKSREYR